MTATAAPAEDQTGDAPPIARSRFVQYLCLKTDPLWRRLPADVRARGRAEFAAAVQQAAPDVTTDAYSTLGLKVSAELMLWWKADEPDLVQETLSRLLQTGHGQYCQVTHSFFVKSRT